MRAPLSYKAADMKKLIPFLIAVFVLSTAPLYSQAPASTPSPEATPPPSKRKHPKKATPAEATPAPAPAGATPATPVPATPAPTKKAAKTDASATASTPAPGAKPGDVWVNTGSKSKAYHKEDSKYYGKTKKGEYMSEADAIKAGYHLDKEEANPKPK